VSDNHEQQWIAKLAEGPFDLTQELAKWRELRETVMPADVVARMDRATTELAASRFLTGVPAVGCQAPSYLLPNAVGEEISLHRLLARGPVVISFYRRVWCPFCNLEQRALQQHLPHITTLGASPVAISGGTPENSMSLVERFRLTYEVLIDTGLRVARRYGLVFEVPEYLRHPYARMGHPVARFNGTAEHSLPNPATFVVETGGIIRFAYANANYMYRADPADVLAALARC
jgi:peroxiredoxin